jgi:hypothetical protein
MQSEDWSMIAIVGIVVLFFLGMLTFEESSLLVLMNIAAMIADHTKEA